LLLCRFNLKLPAISGHVFYTKMDIFKKYVYKL